jgi:4-aminobutyrate aminotransferase-like enzyme
MQREKLVQNSAVVGHYLGQQLQEAFSDHPFVGDIRGIGMFWTLEFVRNRETKQPFPAKRHLAWEIWQRAFERGLVVYYSQGCADGADGDLIMLGPPLITTAAQVDDMVTILREAVRDELGD